MAKPKITQELVDKAEELKRSGLTNRDICAALGITEQTFYRWLSKPTCRLHRSLSETLKKAESEYKAELLEAIMATATREKNPQWTAAAWLLERKYPDEYAQTTRKTETDADDTPHITLGVEVRVAGGDGDSFWIFYSYNPPRTMWSWVNVECLERQKHADTLVRRSSYLDVVDAHPEWLGEPFIDEAEYLRDVNETAWRWEYLGEATGTGGNVFTNIIDKRLSLSRIRNVARTRNGVDWGWFPDPWRFVRCAWEPSARRLLIFEEHSANRKTPAGTAQILLDAMTYADEDGGSLFFTMS